MGKGLKHDEYLQVCKQTRFVLLTRRFRNGENMRDFNK
jgi:hypothetical protein